MGFTVVAESVDTESEDGDRTSGATAAATTAEFVVEGPSPSVSTLVDDDDDDVTIVVSKIAGRGTNAPSVLFRSCWTQTWAIRMS